VTWSSSNEAVVTVANGEVKAVGEGFAVVTATATSDSTLFDAVKIHELDILLITPPLFIDYVSDTHVKST
jgi:hypothetical protein